MHRLRLPLVVFLAVSVSMPLSSAAHTEPTGVACVGGYNSQATLNVCYALPSVDPSNWIVSQTECLYVIGNLPGCVTFPTVSWAPLGAIPGVWVGTSYECYWGGHSSPYCVTVRLP